MLPTQEVVLIRIYFQSYFPNLQQNHLRGTGLGLYISKSIIEAHGGRIQAENNKEGRGATFIFTLPISNVDSPMADDNHN